MPRQCISFPYLKEIQSYVMRGLRLNFLLVFLLYKDKISPQRLTSACLFWCLFPLPKNNENCQLIHSATFPFSHLCCVWFRVRGYFPALFTRGEIEAQKSTALSPRNIESVHNQPTSNSISVLFLNFDTLCITQSLRKRNFSRRVQRTRL